jgi:hypothetical protein
VGSPTLRVSPLEARLSDAQMSFARPGTLIGSWLGLPCESQSASRLLQSNKKTAGVSILAKRAERSVHLPELHKLLKIEFFVAALTLFLSFAGGAFAQTPGSLKRVGDMKRGRPLLTTTLPLNGIVLVVGLLDESKQNPRLTDSPKVNWVNVYIGGKDLKWSPPFQFVWTAITRFATAWRFGSGAPTIASSAQGSSSAKRRRWA